MITLASHFKIFHKKIFRKHLLKKKKKKTRCTIYLICKDKYKIKMEEFQEFPFK